MADIAKKGDKVGVEYTGTLDDGKVFDSSVGRGPLAFTLGSGEVIKGFDVAVTGMTVGEEKTVKIPHDNAYGDVNPSLVHDFPRDRFPEGTKVGAMLWMQQKEGGQGMPARVSAMTDSTVTLDLNHPLAGKDLNFKLKLVSVN
jgi:peptidylprolyl isomerase